MLRWNYFKSLKGFGHLFNAFDSGCGSFPEIINFRHYSRWVHRRPSRVYPSELASDEPNGEVKRFNESVNDPYLGTDTKTVNLHNFSKSNSKQEKLRNPQSELPDGTKFSGMQTRSPNKFNSTASLFRNVRPGLRQTSMTTPDVSDKIRQSAANLGVPIFDKSKDGESKLSNIMLSVKSMKKTKSRDIALLEGRRLIQDSVDAGVLPLMIFFSRVDDLKLLSLPATGIELYKVPYKTLSLWSDLSTCPGIMGIIKIPTVDQVKPSTGSLPVIVICDNIRDPGNLGSVLRTAAGAGCQKVILTKGCVEPWESKVLRAGMGAHFHIPIHANVSWDTMNNLLGNNCRIFLADNRIPEFDSGSNHQITDSAERDQYSTGDTAQGRAMSNISFMPYYDVDFASGSHVVLVVGGETEGLSMNAYLLAQEKQGMIVTVPLSNNVESLNAGTALGIISFEVKRQFCLKAEDSDK